MLALRRRASKRRQKEHQGWVSYSRLRSQNAANSVAPHGGLAGDQALQKVVAGLQFDCQVGSELLRKMRCKWALAALFGARQVAQAQRALAEEALWRQKEPLLRPCFWALWRNVLRRRTKHTGTARPRATALSFCRRRTLERFLRRWMAYSRRRIILWATQEAAMEKLRRRVLRNGLRGWRAWQKKKVWMRDAVERAREWKERRHLRLCFWGWQGEAGKRRTLLERLMSPGARNKGSERVFTPAHYHASPSWAPKKARHVALVSFSHVAAHDLSSPRGPLDPGVSHWAVALLRKIDSAIEIRTAQQSAGLEDLPKEKQEYGQLRSVFASASAGGIRSSQRQENEITANTSDPRTGVFTMEDACELYHARSVAQRALLAWKNECERTRSAMDFARASEEVLRATRILRGWLSSLRRRKNAAESHWRAAVILRVFKLWKKRARQSALLREQLEAALRGRRHRSLSLALWGWREWGVNKRRQRERIAEVEVEILRRRLEAAFGAWRGEAARKGRKRNAVRRGLKAGYGRVWRHWAWRAKARVLLRRVFAEAEARWTVAARFPSHHSEFQAALVCFATWRAFTLHRAADRAEAVRTGAADVYNRARLLTKAFQALRIPVDEHRAQKKEELFRRKMLWAWRKWAERKKDGATARVLARFRVAAGGRTVGEFNRARVLRGFVRVWRRATEEKRARAESYRARSSVKRALNGWVKIREESQERVAVHTRRWERVELGGVLNEWKKLGLERKERERKVEVGKRKVGRRLQEVGLEAWKAYSESRRHKRSVSLLARKHASLLLKRRTLRSWLARFAWRDLKERANQLREHRLKRATWRALIRHTRESQVVRDLVIGSRTRGFSVATSLHSSRARVSLLGSGRVTPRFGQGTPKSGRDTPRLGRATPRAAPGKLKAGGDPPKPARKTSNSALKTTKSDRKELTSGWVTPESGQETPSLGRGTLTAAREGSKICRQAPNPARETPNRAPDSPESDQQKPTSSRGTPNPARLIEESGREELKTATNFSEGQALRSARGVPQTSRFAALEEGEKRTRKSGIRLRKKGFSENVSSGLTAIGVEGQGKGSGKVTERLISEGRAVDKGGALRRVAGSLNGGHVSPRVARVESESVRATSRGPSEFETTLKTDKASAEGEESALTSAAEEGPALTSAGGLREIAGDDDGLAGCAELQERADLETEGRRLRGGGRLAPEISTGSDCMVLDSPQMESPSAMVADCEREVTGRMDVRREPFNERLSVSGEIVTEARDVTAGRNGPGRKSVCGIRKERSGQPVSARHVAADVSPVESETLAGTAERIEGPKRGGGAERRARRDPESNVGRTEAAGSTRVDAIWERGEVGNRGATLRREEAKAGDRGRNSYQATGGAQREVSGGMPRSEKRGAGTGARTAKNLAVLSPQSVGGLSPWEGAESVWSPEGIPSRGHAVSAESGCPPEHDGPGGFWLGTNDPPEDNGGTEWLRNRETSLAADHLDLDGNRIQTDQKTTVLPAGGDGRTRGSRTFVEAEHGRGAQGRIQVQEKVELREGVPQEWADGSRRDRNEAAGGAEGADHRKTAGNLRTAICDGGRNPGIRESGMEDGMEGVVCAPGEVNLVESGEETSDRCWEETGMDDCRLASARGLGRASIGNVHVATSRQSDGQFDGESNRRIAGNSDRQTLGDEQRDAVEFSRGGYCTVWARPPKQSASLDENECQEWPAIESFARLLPSSGRQERRSAAEQEGAFSHHEEWQPDLQSADGCDEALGEDKLAPFRELRLSADEGSDQWDRESCSSQDEGRADVAAVDVLGNGVAGKRTIAKPLSIAGRGRVSGRSIRDPPDAPTGVNEEVGAIGDFPFGLETEERKSWSLQGDGNWDVRERGVGAGELLSGRLEADRFCETVAPVRNPSTAAATEEQGRRREDVTAGVAVRKSAARWPPDRLPRGIAGLSAGALEKETAGKTRHGSLVRWPPGAFESSGSRRNSGKGYENGNDVLPPSFESPGAKHRRASAPSVALEAAGETPTGPELVRGFRVVEPDCALGPRHCTNSIPQGNDDLQAD
ncbi:hypothetical protein KFL_000310240 [Klebsormidium nitens]|uniref:Sfi1 spindle body domain-containing protein n=1 Tax=Klebsormidium nitens TaxID=105231 RepID=A0A1Y1HLI9_KLENI|nr:hypothetical protein KFL_000310240 [Klebsormidium nitens]|eukprot:GAQ79474.1 hypothetical protein KFL_000310240 [Klebsormidium nitens]